MGKYNMKSPNGYGSVYKLPGNRRRPWAIRITVSREETDDGCTHWKYKYLGYYETKPAAMIALAEYNKQPYDVEASKITFTEVYEKWSTEHFPRISESNVKGYRAAYQACKPLYDKKFSELKKTNLQGIIDTCGKNFPTLQRIKILFNQLYKFALENDICTRDYSKYVDISQYKDRNPNKIEHKPFTTNEIQTLWDLKDTDEYITVILMLIYSGVRINELLDLKKENVNLAERWFDVTASKTSAGIRKVPIAKKTIPFFEYWMKKNDCKYLISTRDEQHLIYKKYLDSYWRPFIEQMGMDHHPHDTRHTCISLMVAKNIDDRIIKKIVGHSGKDVTETVYTHFEIQPLLEAIDMI